ncbi:MAG: signal recognition particle receptor subunit alpha [Candidatus Aenigmarchaeota archaeon]|nr:signal recognition particle receptor subunit alpha [Candidatus Aenigmarchaeota archaeon]
MLDNLGKNLGELIRNLITGTSVDKEAVEGVLQDLRKILLQSDVDIDLIDKLVADIRKKCLQEKTPAGLTLREHVLKTIYDELVSLLGEKPAEGDILTRKRIMFVGLFGSGKTTTIAKLARYLKKRGKTPALVALDYHRPAAPQQLQQLGEQLGVPVHVSEQKDPYAAVREATEKFTKNDVIIFDTAGRNALDADLAAELKKLGDMIKPDEVILAIPADLGKIARRQADEFNKLVGITGVIVTKMDGTAKAGGALAAAAATGAKVKFIGTGEKLDELDQYDPTRFVSRMLGLGDMQTLLDKAKEAELRPELAEKMLEGKFTLDDFFEQIESVGKIGSLDKIAGMLPGLGALKLPQDALAKQEQQLKKYKTIIQSLTKEERTTPSLLNSVRVKRVAKGAGVAESDVREMLKQYEQIKKLTRMLGRGNKDMMKMIKQLGGKMPF